MKMNRLKLFLVLSGLLISVLYIWEVTLKDVSELAENYYYADAENNDKDPEDSVKLTYKLEELTVKSGDNLAAILRSKMTYREALELVEVFKKKRSPSDLQVGDEFIFYISNHNQAEALRIARVDWKFSKNERVVASKKINYPGIEVVKIDSTTTNEYNSQTDMDKDKLSKKNKNPESEISGNLSLTKNEFLEKAPEATYEWTARKLDQPSTISYVFYEGEIEDSLWASGKKAGLPDSHIAGLADLFAWEVDFSREVRAGHKWRMVVEKINYLGKKPSFGKIVATTYVKGSNEYTAVRWNGDDNVRSGYFSPNGSSLRRMFLKAPIDFARISSRFSMARFHPILKVNKPHLGVDYAARIGTPVKAIGSGVVIHKGYSKVAGNTIKIRHNATYTTAYKHLNGYARKLRKGSQVDQGQVIGFVGTTGRSTGPHLHFELKKDGRIIDPLSETFPSADPFPKKHMDKFKIETKKYLTMLYQRTNVSLIKKKSNL